MLRSAASFVAIWDEIRSLRKICLAEDDVLLDPLHFLAGINSEGRSLCSVACWSGERLIGLLLVTQHLAWGKSTGYAIGGDCAGRGLLLCKPEDEIAVVQAGVECMFSEGIHSLHLRLAPRTSEKPAFPKLRVKLLDADIPGDRINLCASYEEFLSSLGKHTRRNIRAYTRKTVEKGLSFEPWVDEEKFLHERERLNGLTCFPQKRARLLEDDRLLALHSGGQRMALQAADGTLVSLMYGFTRGKRFHVLTQWNDPSLHALSLSVVLRGYAAEHLIDRGHDELQFMGGLSLSFGRFCPPHQYYCLSVDRRFGLEVVAKKVMAAYCLKIAKAGKEPSSTAKTLSGGFLDSALLGERITLPPSSVASSVQTAIGELVSDRSKAALVRSVFQPGGGKGTLMMN